MIDGQLWWLRAETSIHVGSGNSASLVDQPFMREAHTSYPFIPGSGMKGALRDFARNDKDVKANVDTIFGKTEAGSVLISDARIAFLPLRSLTQPFFWVTCPYVLKRLIRDMSFVGIPDAAGNDDGLTELRELSKKALSDDQAITHGTSTSLIVEDQKLTLLQDKNLSQKDDNLSAALEFLFPPKNDKTPNQIGINSSNTVIVSDELFGFFARRRLPVRMRTRLEEDTKTVADGALWSEESLPPETLLYVVLSSRLKTSENPSKAGLEALSAQLAGKIVQIGGNETVGEGWFSFMRYGKPTEETS